MTEENALVTRNKTITGTKRNGGKITPALKKFIKSNTTKHPNKDPTQDFLKIFVFIIDNLHMLLFFCFCL